MRRFFLSSALSQNMILRGNDAYHAGRVLRMKSGDHLIVVDNQGHAGEAEILNITEEEISLLLCKVIAEEQEAPIAVYLAQALPKADKMDYIIQKAVELGVDGVYPWSAAHSVVQYNEQKSKSRCERWQKIALEAAKQCKRSRIPVVERVHSLSEILSVQPEETGCFLLYEGAAVQGLKQVLQTFQARRYLLIVGPEGGISQPELALCREHGVVPVNMGPRILRTETAALAGIAVVMYDKGDLGG